MKRITSNKQFKAAMTTVETLLDKATRQGGFHTLTDRESEMLADLSKQVEHYEDKTLNLMPIAPKSIKEAIEYKRISLALSQAQMAEKLGIGAPKLSQILSGKRPPDVEFLLALYTELKIDSQFLFDHLERMGSRILFVNSQRKSEHNQRDSHSRKTSKRSAIKVLQKLEVRRGGSKTRQRL